MSAEIICVGTELLLGDIVNTNVQFLAKELAILGIPHYYQTVVGDNPTRLKEVISIASQRSSILLFTGGLGPTPDDLTTETIAQHFNTPLVEKSEVIEDIQRKFQARGRQMAENNRKQALIPEGAAILPNPTGTAPGMIWQPQGNLTIMTFPGVPSEMKRMWVETAVPHLKSQGWGKEIIFSRMLRFRGIGESSLAAKVNHLFDLTNPTVAPYASLGEVRLRISCKTTSETEANTIIEPVAQEIIKIAGEDYFGRDDDTLAKVVGQLLRNKKQTVGVAESCTGGGLGGMLTDIAGSSDYFWGGVIAYDNRVKIFLLDVSPEVLEERGAVCDIVAQQMANGVKKRLGVDWGIGITGIAGPGGGTEVKPVGLVYLGIAGPNDEVESIKCTFGDRSRDIIRYLSSCTALDKLRRKLY
ncbi:MULTISPECIES: competence/damage-inducible protein A [Crocosphaera]|uniref:CinA-like protein n=4 Tax=Crocosphaera watsonii TaxID=263511 RepID=T2JYL0_CROWT|nr:MULTISPECIES: competence/damage-inducible protein A [Crocosphaera]EHJ13691.1 Competence/damage-inducible protein CinA [Crocosphaera watsonii WH 0003]MCH2243517.1 competence/damage-inducible protein A [Crocosphaera sp.]CCQ58446.1 Competence/damage-inducible protein CinA [Crocosphaera watsonii WH 0005]CCQ63798.1 Competence/damage-inducible protein CinA [Crocosphaera watsonii WH 0401]CCQ69722.1 Competence/damage-inducible protein CinA [Crocosphaera watsonii WH 0402]